MISPNPGSTAAVAKRSDPVMNRPPLPYPLLLHGRDQARKGPAAKSGPPFEGQESHKPGTPVGDVSGAGTTETVVALPPRIDSRHAKNRPIDDEARAGFGFAFAERSPIRIDLLALGRAARRVRLSVRGMCAHGVAEIDRGAGQIGNGRASHHEAHDGHQIVGGLGGKGGKRRWGVKAGGG